MKRFLCFFLAIISSVLCSAYSAIPKDCETTTEYFNGLDLLHIYRPIDSVEQLLLVDHTGGSHATAKYYIKDNKLKYSWLLKLETDALVGWGGVGKEREGDGKTPLGDYGITTAFGIKDNPGTELPYICILEDTVCCSDNSSFYNQIVRKSDISDHYCTGEPMIHSKPDFNYGVMLNYNSDCTYPDGSGIFLHCIGQYDYTFGCVAIPEEDMLTIIQTANSGLRIIIFE